MALDDPVFGRNLAPTDFVFDDAAQQIRTALGSGLTRAPAGTWSLDLTAVQAIIDANPSSGLDQAAVEAIVRTMLDALPPGGGFDPTALGFDADAETLTLTIRSASEERQIVCEMPGVVTIKELDARSEVIVDVFGAPTKYSSITRG